MHNANTWFEIPVADLGRSQRFYEAMLERPMRRVEDAGGESMAVFAHEKPGAGGCLVHRPTHRPVHGGTLVYLDCTPSVDSALQRARTAGGRVTVPRTLIAPGSGYFAQIEDPDGNFVGLHAAA